MSTTVYTELFVSSVKTVSPNSLTFNFYQIELFGIL